MAKEVTLDELVRNSSTNAKVTEKTNETANAQPAGGIKSARPVSTSELGKALAAQHPEIQKKIVEEDAPLVANAFAAMDETLERKKDFIQNTMMPIVMENAREMALEKELEENGVSTNETTENETMDDFAELDENDAENATPDKVVEYKAPEKKEYNIPAEEFNEKEAPKKSTKKVNEENSNTDLDSLMEDLGLNETEDDMIEDEETTEELRERFKASMASVKVTRNPINLSQFQIAKEPISSAAVLNTISNPIKKRCDWPLLHTGRNMTFEECSGPELDALRKTINNSNGVNGVIASLRFVYNHNVDANKKSFEAWCKSIRTEDIESLYFGMYKACYADANLVARADMDEKKGCKKTSLIDTPINDMAKFEDDDAKALFDKLMASDTTNPGTKIKSNMMVVSDDLVVSYSDPTLYSTFIQYASLNQNITEKYADQLNTMAYIDGFFRIDQANKQLIPIAIKEYPNNINKTVMSKLKAYIDILKTLTNDQYNIMVGKLDNVIGNAKISYIYPETTCPECGNTIPEEPVESMLNLLFTRAQLVQVKSL